MAPRLPYVTSSLSQPANHASSHGRRARAVRSLFIGKERAPSESVLGVRAVPLFTENPRRGVLGNPYSSTRIPIRYRDVWWRYVCSASFREAFFSETQLTLPAKRRSFGSCQCPPRVGKHYQNYDEDCHYLRYCDNSFQCSPWRKEYPRRSQKEVERTNYYGAPVAPWFEHP